MLSLLSGLRVDLEVPLWEDVTPGVWKALQGFQPGVEGSQLRPMSAVPLDLGELEQRWTGPNELQIDGVAQGHLMLMYLSRLNTSPSESDFYVPTQQGAKGAHPVKGNVDDSRAK